MNHDARSRRASHASGCPKPKSVRESSVRAKAKQSEAEKTSPGRSASRKDKSSCGRGLPPKSPPKPVEDRIVLVDPDAEEDADDFVSGGGALRQCARAQRAFEGELKEESYQDIKPLALWLSLDAETGEVKIYPRAAATRLEGGFVNNRSNVPLAGLDCGCENDTVYLPKDGGVERFVHKCWDGAQMDVRRLQVRVGVHEVCINVVRDSVWRIADAAVPGKTEQCRVALAGSELVRPPPPALPPLDPDRRAYFCNNAPELEGLFGYGI